MNPESAFTAVIEANPVPDAQVYAEHRIPANVFLAETRERTATMTTIKDQETTTPPTRGKRQPLLAVAAVVLLVVAATIAATTLGQNSDVATDPEPTVRTLQETVDAYFVAVNTGDAEAYLGMFSAGASNGDLDPGGIASDEKIALRLEAQTAAGVVWTVEMCELGSEVRISCSITTDSPLGASIFGFQQSADRSIAVTIDDSGLITRIGVQHAPQTDADLARERAMGAWLDEMLPELGVEIRLLRGSGMPHWSGTRIGHEIRIAADKFATEYDK